MLVSLADPTATRSPDQPPDKQSSVTSNLAGKNTIRKATYPDNLRDSRISRNALVSRCPGSRPVRNLEFVMTANPYSPPVESFTRIRTKRRFIKSGARLLFFAFLIPTFIMVGRVLISDEAPPQTSNLDLLVAGGIEIINALAGVCALVGIIMLCQDPHDLPKKVSLWERGSVVVVSGTFALLCLLKCVCLLFLDIEHYNQLLVPEFHGRWAAMLGSLWLIRAISELGSNDSMSRLATAAIVTNVVAHGVAILWDAVGVLPLFSIMFFVLQYLLCFGTLWSAQDLEVSFAPRPKKRAKPKRRTAIVSSDKAA